MRRIRNLATLLLAMAFALVMFPGCSGEDSGDAYGEAEATTQDAEKAVNDAADAVGDAAEDVGEAVHDASHDH